MATAKAPFGYPALQKKSQQPNTKANESLPSKKSNTREQVKTTFFDALRENKDIEEEMALNLAESIETEIFSLFNTDSNRNYREKANTIKMKLKGQRNQNIRTALIEERISPAQLVNEPNLTELIENSSKTEKAELSKPEQNTKPQPPKPISSNPFKAPSQTLPPKPETQQNETHKPPQQIKVPPMQPMIPKKNEVQTHHPQHEQEKYHQEPPAQITKVNNISKPSPQKDQGPIQQIPAFTKANEQKTPEIQYDPEENEEKNEDYEGFKQKEEMEIEDTQENQEQIEQKVEEIEYEQEPLEENNMKQNIFNENEYENENENENQYNIGGIQINYENNDEEDKENKDFEEDNQDNLDQELKEFEKHRQDLKKQQYDENQGISPNENPNENEYYEENNQEFANNECNDGEYFEENYNENYNNNDNNDNENNGNFNKEEEEMSQNINKNSNDYEDNNKDNNTLNIETNKEENANEFYENQQVSEQKEESNNNEEEPSNQALYGSKNRSNNFICPDEDKSEGFENEAKSEGKLFEKKAISPKKSAHNHKNEQENVQDPSFIRILQLELEVTTEKEKVKALSSRVEVLTQENKALKANLSEKDKSKGLEHNEIEVYQQQLHAKERECEVLKQEWQAHQKELSLMKAHLNKIIEENSKFREDYLHFKKICEDEKNALQAELDSVKMKENDEKTLEIETLRSNNHILEEKLRLMTTKLELAQKDSSEKDVLLKKLTFSSETSAEDSQIFHQLALEIQRQAHILQDFSMFDAQNYNSFSAPTVFMKENAKEKEENFRETLPIEPIIRENIAKEPIFKEPIVKEHVFDENTKENTNDTSHVKEIKENKEKKHEETHSFAEKNSEKKEIVREPVPFNKITDVKKEIPETPENITDSKEKAGQSKETSPLKKQDVEKKTENIENPANTMSFPPPPPKDNNNNLNKNKKPEENANNIKKNTNRAFPATFNPPKFNSRPPQQIFKSSAETFKPFSSNEKDSMNLDTEQFFSNLSNANSRVNPAEDNKKPFSPQKSSPTRNVISHAHDFKTINPNIFSDKNDEFSQLLKPQGTQGNNQRMIKPGSNKQLPTANTKAGGSLVKGSPNMESTTSIHSTVTEGDIKRGTGARKGIIPNSLFD